MIDTFRLSEMFAEPVFSQVLRNSLIWTAGVVLLQNVLGFLIALLLNQRVLMQDLLRSLVFLPWGAPGPRRREPLALCVRPESG